MNKDRHIIAVFGGVPGSIFKRRVWCINHGRKCFVKLGSQP